MSYAWLSPQHVDFVYNLVVIQVPRTVHEALQVSWWIEAMNVEMTTLEKIPCKKLYLLLNIRNLSVIDECSLLNMILVVSWSNIKYFQCQEIYLNIWQWLSTMTSLHQLVVEYYHMLILYSYSYFLKLDVNLLA